MAKLIFDKEELLGKLKKAAAFVPKKAVLSSHETFLIDIKSGQANITATDGNKQITVKCDTLKSDTDVMFTIPAKLLIHVLNLLIEKEITITTKKDKVEVKSGKSKYNMPSEDGTAYPVMQHISADFEASFTGMQFNKAMEITKAYADPENASPALQGICLRAGKDNAINAYGCTSSHAAKVIIHPRSINKWDDVVIPVSALTAIGKCIPDGDIVDLIHNKDRIEINTEDVSIKALCFAVKYPNVEQFFDKRPDHFVEMNTVQMLHALQRIDVFSPKEVPTISIDIQPTLMTIKTDDEMFSHDAEEEIDIIAEKNIYIGVNVKLFINIMESFTNDMFRLYYLDFNKAITIEPISVIDNNDMFFILMPLLIK